MISLLIPSKNRFDSFISCLYRNQKVLKNHKFEVLVRCYFTDEQLPKYQDAADSYGYKLLVTSLGDGYENLHVMYNQLCEVASGDWLWLLSDDAYISRFDVDKMPDGWNELAVISNDPILEHNWFPMISRRLYNTMGHFAMGPHLDTYVMELGDALGIHRYIDGVEITNLREEINDDVTKQKNGVINQTSADHWGPVVRKYLAEDIEKVGHVLNAKKDHR